MVRFLYVFVKAENIFKFVIKNRVAILQMNNSGVVRVFRTKCGICDFLLTL